MTAVRVTALHFLAAEQRIKQHIQSCTSSVEMACHMTKQINGCSHTAFSLHNLFSGHARGRTPNATIQSGLVVLLAAYWPYGAVQRTPQGC